MERIATPSAESLDRAYLRQRLPVILTDLFEGSPIARLADPMAARATLATLPVPVMPNPVDRAVRGLDVQSPTLTTFARFYDLVTTGRGVGSICAEHELPDRLAALFPPVTQLQVGDPADSWVALMFMAGRGNATHLHFDRDLRHDLIYQVFGRKRYVIIDVGQTRKVAAMKPSSAAPYASRLFLEHFSRKDLEGFLRYTDAWDCILGPGETVLVPATAWHYVEYLDTALSVHLRLPRNRHVHALAEAAERVATCSVELQALAARLLDEDMVGAAEGDAVAALATASDHQSLDALTKAVEFDRLCLRACEQFGLSIAGPAYDLADMARRTELDTAQAD